MSKKLIAVASAAALALSALVATPASAAPFSVALLGMQEASTGNTASAPAVVLVPSQDVLRFDEDPTASTTGTLVRLTVTATAAAANVTATASAGTKLLTATQYADLADMTTASGAESVSGLSDAGANVVFYAYTTTTAKTTITVAQASTTNSATIHLQGLSADGNTYTMNLTATTTTAPSGTITITGTFADMFGNLMTLETADVEVKGIGGNFTGGALTQTSFAVNATTKVHTIKVANRSTAGVAGITVGLATAGDADGAEEVTAFGDQNLSAFFTVTAADLTAANAALTAQVAALQAQLEASRPKATSVTKKRWNKLVRAHRALGGTAKLK